MRHRKGSCYKRHHHLCGAGLVHGGELVTKPWPGFIFIFSLFDKLQNQVDTKNTGKDVQTGVQALGGDIHRVQSAERRTDLGLQAVPPPQARLYGQWPRLPSQLLGFLTEHSRVLEGSMTT